LTKPAPKNLPASVRQKVANLARERNVDFGLILFKYGLERILFRLSRSRHRDDLILKGALLFELWTERRCRPTRDADSFGRGDNAPERFTRILGYAAIWKSTMRACASMPRPFETVIVPGRK